jgi:hypothetical protein
LVGSVKIQLENFMQGKSEQKVPNREKKSFFEKAGEKLSYFLARVRKQPVQPVSGEQGPATSTSTPTIGGEQDKIGSAPPVTSPLGQQSKEITNEGIQPSKEMEGTRSNEPLIDRNPLDNQESSQDNRSETYGPIQHVLEKIEDKITEQFEGTPPHHYVELKLTPGQSSFTSLSKQHPVENEDHRDEGQK